MNTLIDFENNVIDKKFLILVILGFSDRCIKRETGLTKDQIRTRIIKSGLTGYRQRYRNGTEAIAKKLISVGMQKADAQTLLKVMSKEIGFVA